MDSVTRAIFVAALALSGLPGPAAFAQEGFPTRPIKMVVPYAAGGLPDTMARVVGQRVGESVGQQVVIENRPSAGGIVACELVAKSPPDGYTLLVADVGQTAINPALYSKLSYDPLKDFVPVTLLGTSPLFLVSNPSVPVNSFRELVALAKSKPGQLNYASSGTGSIHHLTMESLKAALGINFVHVPYKGAGQAIPALLGGQVALGLAALPAITAHIKTGKLKVLAVNTLKRSDQAPDVPTVAESGVAGFDFPAKIGVMAPAGTPAPIVAKISAELAKAVRHPETLKRFAALGIDPVGSTPDQYDAENKADIEKYARAVKVSGAKID